MNKNKIVVAIVLVAIVVIVGGYLFLKSTTSPGSITNTKSPESTTNTNKGIIPSLGESTNPMKNKPNVNPIDTSNPFRSIKTNPFK